MDFDFNKANAALNLEGQTLANGWTVGPLHNPPSAVAAGRFSVSYTVTNSQGRLGFLKVVDLVSVFGNLKLLSDTLNDYLAERDILVMCGEKRLSRVVLAIDHGQFTLPGFLLGDVNYIVFELASRDVNVALSQSEKIDVVLKIDMLHHLAVGLRQLHRYGVAHQDLKPSNLLVFDGIGGDKPIGKIADLGRAYRADAPAPHDALIIPGDKSYAPPEQLYKFVHPDVSVRRYAADLYQLGNLACFMFSGITMNALMSKALAPEHHWNRFGDGYLQALPYLVEAHDRVIAALGEQLPRPVASSMASTIHYLSRPDAEKRGHPKAHVGNGSPFSLERVVADINLMAKRTAFSIARAK